MSSSQKKAPPFLIKTYEMLQNASFSDIICWNQEENGFIIQDIELFSSKILPIYFKHKNMHSYIRQLNMYGFSKKRGRSNNYYYHPYFVRKQPELICQIQRRVENKGPKMMKTSTSSIEDQIPEPLHMPLLKMNQLMLLQQCANLQMVLNEVEDPNLRFSFSQAMGKYLESQNRLLQRINGIKQKEQVMTAGTLHDECSGAVDECSQNQSH